MICVILVKGYFHSTTLIQSFLKGFFKLRQNKARGGLGFKLGFGLRGLVLRLAAADIVAATLVAASAVFHAQLSGGPSPSRPSAAPSPGTRRQSPSPASNPLSQASGARANALVDLAP